MAACPNCRTAINMTQAFCHACGLPLTPNAWESAPPPGAQPAATPGVAPASASAPFAYAMPRRNDGGAVASMVLGILGLVGIPVIASIVALALGYGARSRIRASRDLDGEGFATAGIVTGWIGVVLPLLAILVVLAMWPGF